MKENIGRGLGSTLLGFLHRAKEQGATAGGVFGSFTIDPRNASDIDVVLIKPGTRRGGETYRDGILHVTELPPNVMEDHISTFGHQAVKSSRWMFGKKPGETDPHKHR